MNTLTKEDMDTIAKIAKRASKLLDWDRLTVVLDVSTVHEDACPLRLDDLLNSNDFEFSHDIMGMNRNLDHLTHKLINDFLPRFAA